MTNIGKILLEKREEKELSLLDVFERTGIKIEVLKQIEENNWEKLPIKKIPRWLKQYAEMLELDADPLLLAFVKTLSEENEEIKEATTKKSLLKDKTQWGLYLLTFVALLIVGMILVLTFQEKKGAPFIQQTKTLQNQTGTSVLETTSSTATTTTDSSETESVPEVLTPPFEIVMDAEKIGKEPIIPVVLKNVETTNNILVEVNNQRCWVRVGANGLVIYNQTLKNKEKGQITLPKGTKEAQLVLGAGQFAKVSVNGVAFPDLKAVGPNPVTFEFKLEK